MQYSLIFNNIFVKNVKINQDFLENLEIEIFFRESFKIYKFSVKNTINDQ